MKTLEELQKQFEDEKGKGLFKKPMLNYFIDFSKYLYTYFTEREKKLIEYVKHDSDCASRVQNGGPSYKCTCGLSDLLPKGE